MFRRTEDEVNANVAQKAPIFGAFASGTDDAGAYKPGAPISSLEPKKPAAPVIPAAPEPKAEVAAPQPINPPAAAAAPAPEPKQVIEAPKPINTAPLKTANQPAIGSFAPSYNKAAPATPAAAPAASVVTAPNPAIETERRLTVGYGITLQGEISDCDRLVIYGNVNAKLNNVKFLQISESGKFAGRAMVEQAEVSGSFEGELVVKHSIVISTTGRVNGKITYGSIEIRPGGKFTGEIVEAPEANNTQPAVENAASASSEYYGLYDSQSSDKAA